MKKLFLLLIFILLFCPTLSHSNTITGKVISVTDGDSITILNGSQQTKIRLYGIDTPEKAQAFGKQAKKFTASLTAGKQVSVEVYDTDRYGRSVGVVFINGINVNEEIIRAGYAWQYRKYCNTSFCDDWLKLEDHARSFAFGLWADSNPQPPWKWRYKKNIVQLDGGEPLKKIHNATVLIGDTLRYFDNNTSKYKRLRLYGIAAPSYEEPFFETSKKMLSIMTLNKTLEIKIVGVIESPQLEPTEYAYVFFNGVSVNAAMVKSGYSWVVQEACKEPDCETWKSYQAYAKEKRKGGWSQKGTTAPRHRTSAKKAKQRPAIDEFVSRWKKVSKKNMDYLNSPYCPPAGPPLTAGDYYYPSASSKDVWVDSYSRSNGTGVRGHYRSSPRR